MPRQELYTAGVLQYAVPAICETCYGLPGLSPNTLSLPHVPPESGDGTSGLGSGLTPLLPALWPGNSTCELKLPVYTSARMLQAL